MRDATRIPELRKSGAASQSSADRRPIRSRDARWAQTAASWLAGHGVTPKPNLSSKCRGGGNRRGWPGLLFAALERDDLRVRGVQLRLLCNLLDGMVAVEQGKQTPFGVLYNEMPDRVSDSALLYRSRLCFRTAMAGLAWRTFGGTDSLYSSLRGSAWVRSGFSRSHGQATPDGSVNSRLSPFHSRAFRRSNQSHSAGHLRTDCRGFVAHLLDAHPGGGAHDIGPLKWWFSWAFAF